MGICYKCGAGFETGRSFVPVEPAGTPNRKWVCIECKAEMAKNDKKENDNG